MKKKIFGLMMAGILLASTGLAGCAGGGQSLKTITVYSQLANWDGEQAGFFSTLLEDKFGVKMIIIKDEAGVYNTRMDAQDLGDIVIWNENGERYQQAVAQGLLFAWEDENLLDNYGKDIKQYFSIGLEANRAITNGIEDLDERYKDKIYGIGNKLCQSEGDHEAFYYIWDIRWDLYKELGYPEVKDLDDYANLLAQMKEIEPLGEDGNPTYAFSLWKDWDDKMVMNVKAFATSYYGCDEMGVGLYDTATGTYHDALEENGPYLTSLAFFNKLYRMGLIDPDSMSQTFNEVGTKLHNGRVFASTFNFSGYMVYNTVDRLEQGKMMASLVPEEAKPAVYGLNPNGSTFIWSIGSKTRYPEKCMEILNWLATPEGSMTMFHGLQGVHWDYAEDGGIYYTEFGERSIKDKTTLQDGAIWKSPYTGKEYTLSGRFSDGELQLNNTFWVRDAVNIDPRANGERFNEDSWASYSDNLSKYAIAQDWATRMGTSDRQKYLEGRKTESGDLHYTVVPAFNYFESRKDVNLSRKWNQVVDCIKNYSWQAIYAKSEKQFEILVSQMKKDSANYGYQDCVDWSIAEARRKFPG